MRTSGMTRAAISLNTAASIGELWISPSVGTGRVLPGSILEVVASATDLEADEIADAGEVADIGMLADRPAAIAPRSEEHTSAPQSQMRCSTRVLCLKKHKMTRTTIN